MPSGAKKRKAAKKKKEQAANTINSSTNNSPCGNDDPKSQDERDSDSGDVGSSTSQDDHNHQHPFSQEEEEGKRAPSPVQSHVTEEKSVEEATRDAESIEKSGLNDVDVKIEKEWEPKEDLESTHVPIQHVEHDKSSSSSSSSGDESQALQKKSKEEACNLGSEVVLLNNEDKSATIMSEEVQKVVENETLGDVDRNYAEETVAVGNLVKTVLSVPEEVDYATEIPANKSVADVVESRLKDSEEKSLPSSNGISRVALAGNEGKFFPASGIPTAEISNVAEINQESRPHDYSIQQNPEEVNYATEISANKSVADVVESGLKESEEKLLPSSNGIYRVELEGNEGKIYPSSDTLAAETSNIAETNQESWSHDFSKKQPPVAPTPPVVQRTSLLSCCGLFDVFTGSGR
ncbi:uncharacterized protein LOC111274914 [Durio zibethinus]|uniref:Uncharacterized protein LOC111274914 n=1 Tax=Durio zibethinus TaxID=66656 RepID=A0A6P5WI92_DURZI|nr:uncharacterized protein LOC111274914 [Durio zibethinus]XP_022715670.1 uncharacterized protein LOC111274914 [Durio zibethinus]